MPVVTKFPNIVTQEISPVGSATQVQWVNLDNIKSDDAIQTYATCSPTAVKTPYRIKARDFQFDIPDESAVIKITVSFRGSTTIGYGIRTSVRISSQEGYSVSPYLPNHETTLDCNFGGIVTGDVLNSTLWHVTLDGDYGPGDIGLAWLKVAITHTDVRYGEACVDPLDANTTRFGPVLRATNHVVQEFDARSTCAALFHVPTYVDGLFAYTAVEALKTPQTYVDSLDAYSESFAKRDQQIITHVDSVLVSSNRFAIAHISVTNHIDDIYTNIERLSEVIRETTSYTDPLWATSERIALRYGRAQSFILRLYTHGYRVAIDNNNIITYVDDIQTSAFSWLDTTWRKIVRGDVSIVTRVRRQVKLG